MKPEKMYYITDHRRYIILEIEVNVLQVRTIFQVVAYILCLTFYLCPIMNIGICFAGITIC